MEGCMHALQHADGFASDRIRVRDGRTGAGLPTSTTSTPTGRLQSWDPYRIPVAGGARGAILGLRAWRLVPKGGIFYA